MEALGIRIELEHRAVAGEPEGGARRQVPWSGRSARSPPAPDGQGSFARYDGRRPAARTWRASRSRRFDALYERMQVLPDGPERDALFPEAKRLALAYMPYKFTLHRISPT